MYTVISLKLIQINPPKCEAASSVRFGYPSKCYWYLHQNTVLSYFKLAWILLWLSLVCRLLVAWVSCAGLPGPAHLCSWQVSTTLPSMEVSTQLNYQPLKSTNSPPLHGSFNSTDLPAAKEYLDSPPLQGSFNSTKLSAAEEYLYSSPVPRGST